MKKFLFLFLPTLLAFATPGDCQDHMILDRHGWSVGVWTAAGSGVRGTTKGTDLWMTGTRLGKVLTGDIGKGPIRGRFEYGVEVIPAFLVFQGSTVYGFDITPLILKWNFTSTKAIVPFMEAGAGLLYTADDVPPRSFPLNFTPQVGFGVHIPTGVKQAVTLSVRYMHISNGSLASPNPGIESVQFLLGYNWF